MLRLRQKRCKSKKESLSFHIRNKFNNIDFTISFLATYSKHYLLKIYLLPKNKKQNKMYHQSNIYTADRQQKQLDQQQQHVKQLQREVAVKRILVSQVSLRRSL